MKSPLIKRESNYNFNWAIIQNFNNKKHMKFNQRANIEPKKLNLQNLLILIAQMMQVMKMKV